MATIENAKKEEPYLGNSVSSPVYATENNKEDALETKQSDSSILKKAFTFFMIPFYYEGEYKVLDAENCPSKAIWEKAKGRILNEEDDVLYPYIINFLQGQIDKETCQLDHLHVYNINSDSKSSAKKFWDAFAHKPYAEADNNKQTKKKEKNEENEKDKSLHVTGIEIENDDKSQKEIRPIKFNLTRDNGYTGFKSPHLFISPTANIGILTFCIELGKENRSLDDFKLLNYALHKISKPLNKCSTPGFQLKNVSFYNEQARISSENKIIDYRRIIEPHEGTDKKWMPYVEFSWNIRTLINMLLADVKGIVQDEGWIRETDVRLFSDTRAHLFSYCQIDGTVTSCEFDDIKLDLMRLSRCVNNKYILPTDETTVKEMCMMTFSNIFFSSSVEGGAMIAIAKKENEEFIKQIDNQSLPRYMAIYLLVLIQRYSMLHINRQLTELCTTSSDAQLWNILNIIKKVKVHCYYTDVSPYSQHNQFYQHCNKNLHVRETFNEIDNKTKILNLTISHDMQKLLEEQKKAIELQRAEDERRERERQQLEKERDRILRTAERKAESGQHRLNLVVGILTVFQVAGVIHQFTDKTCFKWWSVTFTFVISLILLFIVVNWEKEDNSIIKWVRNIYYKKKNNNKQE